MAIRANEIASVLKSQIEQFGSEITTVNIGTVIEVGDGIARVHGLSGVSYNELVEFDGDVVGMALNLEEDSVGIVILGDPASIKEGTEVQGTGKVMDCQHSRSLWQGPHLVDGVEGVDRLPFG